MEVEESRGKFSQKKPRVEPIMPGAKKKSQRKIAGPGGVFVVFGAGWHRKCKKNLFFEGGDDTKSNRTQVQLMKNNWGPLWLLEENG